MHTFEVKDEFYLDGQPVKLISGAIHYFRMVPEQWQDSLYNLKALGANAVETYVPWNLHEPMEGRFDFSGRLDLLAFIKEVEALGLWVILRPAVYICAEWEFGGLPAWLLKTPGIRLRSTDFTFMEKVRNYYEKLIPMLLPMQVTAGGPVIMMQVENEYGSYGMEKEYLRQTAALMKELGVTVPLFTSDGGWQEVLAAGTLIEDDILVTGNFGSQAGQNVGEMKKFFAQHGKNWPIMCMEFWDGWFNRWGEPIVRRDAEDLAKDVKEMLQLGSINLYMFHGGTNFGFMNGCSARGTHDLPQVTSYDYDALLDEAGRPTTKYYAVQRVIKEVCPNVWQAEPRGKALRALGTFPVQESVSLFNTLGSMTERIESAYPLTMEQAGTGYGYLVYQATLPNYQHENKLKVVEASDRIQIFADGEKLATQYQEEIGTELILPEKAGRAPHLLTILVENVGRVNYGYKFNAPTQTKGIRGGVMQDIHFHQGFSQYPLDFSAKQVSQIDFTAKADATQPSLYRSRFTLTAEELGDTYLDCRSFGKGIAILNGQNLGRYWQEGPYFSLYCPKEFFREGENELVIFETEGVGIEEISFVDGPLTNE